MSSREALLVNPCRHGANARDSVEHRHSEARVSIPYRHGANRSEPMIIEDPNGCFNSL